MRALHRILILLVLVLFTGALFYWGRVAQSAIRTVEDLLVRNEQFREAVTALTREDQIGYAEVLEQLRDESGVLHSTIRFVETARGQPERRVRETIVKVQGEELFFDALILKFSTPLVMDGRERSLYLWRRVYGDAVAPRDGVDLNGPGSEPARYADWLRFLPMDQRRLFWQAAWDLADDPERLERFGIQAVFGNAVYQRMRPGRVYLFRINASGMISPEVVSQPVTSPDGRGPL